MQQRAVLKNRRARSRRRILSLLLALTMLFTLGSVTVLADDTDSDASADASPSASPSPAAVPARPENLYVYDGADVLSTETETAVVEKCKALDENCGAQLAVVTMDLMPGSTADERKAYAAQVVQDWNLGGEGGNGLLLVLSISDEDYWLAPTENFQESFTLSVLKSLMNDYIETEFTNKNYDAAVTNFVTAAAEKAEAFVRAQQLASGASPSPEADENAEASGTEKKESGNVFLTILKGIGIVVLVVIGLGIVLVVVAYLHGRSVRKKRMEARRRRRQGGAARPAAPSRTGATQRRSSRSSGGSRNTARPAPRRDDDYRDFMNRYK